MTTSSMTERELEVCRRLGLIKTIPGQRFCMTGVMSVSRPQFSTFIKQLGGIPQNAISSTTNFLIIPAEDDYRRGSKFNEAMSRGIRIITEEEFVAMILPTKEELTS